jgi:tRNA threonylcarbamoyladenosine biosynthesis protein TsaB
MELAVDTSTRYASVALSREGEVLWAFAWRSAQNHTAELAPAVAALLARAGARLSDLSALIVACGPGGFSALRVGMGFVKGLAAGLDVPVAAVRTLEVEAYPYRSMGRPVCPLLDMGRGEVAWALYQEEDGSWRQGRPESIASLEELLAAVPKEALFCGEGAGAHAKELRPRLPREALWAAEPSPTRRPSALASLGFLRLSTGGGDDLAALQPLYLRRPSISQPRRP